MVRRFQLDARLPNPLTDKKLGMMKRHIKKPFILLQGKVTHHTGNPPAHQGTGKE